MAITETTTTESSAFADAVSQMHTDSVADDATDATEEGDEGEASEGEAEEAPEGEATEGEDEDDEDDEDAPEEDEEPEVKAHRKRLAEEYYRLRTEKRKLRDAQKEVEATREKLYGASKAAIDGVQALHEGDVLGGLQRLGLDVDRFASVLADQLTGTPYELFRERQRAAQAEQQAAELRAQQERVRQEQLVETERQKVASSIGGVLVKSRDATLRRVASDPQFLRQVVLLREQYLDPEEGNTIPVEAAADIVLKSARSHYERLHSVFGGAGGPIAEDSGRREPGNPDASGAARAKPRRRVHSSKRVSTKPEDILARYKNKALWR